MSSKSRVCRAPGLAQGQFFGDHPADRAVQAADLIDQPQPASAKIEVPPAAPSPIVGASLAFAARAAQ